MHRDVELIYLNPCCIHKHLGEYLSRKEPTCFFTNSDWGLPQLLELLSLYIPGGELTVCLPKVTDDVVKKLQYLVSEFKSVKQVNLIIDDKTSASNLFANVLSSGTLQVARYPIGFRTIAIGNGERQAVISGSFNQHKMEIGMQLQQLTLCTDLQNYEDVMAVLTPILNIHKN